MSKPTDTDALAQSLAFIAGAPPPLRIDAEADDIPDALATLLMAPTLIEGLCNGPSHLADAISVIVSDGVATIKLDDATCELMQWLEEAGAKRLPTLGLNAALVWEPLDCVVVIATQGAVDRHGY